ncbi:Uncharacterised protein [Mycoplasmopsis columbinasalis]|uniref:Uncharacterized protein n=1 Tax=Mycoplasmopsis columbinasalis TaxID=114880 RepID=A0A449BAG5_9BACT|nr:Uncharacterised protein [Mycoplasmopsis columbinasalis]
MSIIGQWKDKMENGNKLNNSQANSIGIERERERERQ